MHYPEMVKTNARRRGPMESAKQTSQVRDAERSIALIRSKLEKIGQSCQLAQSDVFGLYNGTIPDRLRAGMNDVASVKGGEL